MDKDVEAGAKVSIALSNTLGKMSDDIKREVSPISVNVTLSDRPLHIVQSRENSSSVQRDPSQSSKSWSGSLIGRMSSKLSGKDSSK